MSDTPGINLNGVPPDPADFDGPLNEFIELHGTAVANNIAVQTKLDYEQLHPEPPPPPPPAAPQVKPLGSAVSAGRRVNVDLKDAGKFFIDREIARRIRRSNIETLTGRSRR